MSAMKIPVLFLDAVLFPGLPGAWPLSAEVGRQVSAYGQYLGFGSTEVLLAFPERDDAPASPDNMCAWGSLAEVLIEPGHDEDVTLVIRDGLRVRLEGLTRWPDHHRSGWRGHVAEAVPAAPNVDGLGHVELDRLRRGLLGGILSGHFDDDGQSLAEPRALIDPAMEMGAQTPPWKIVYLVAEYLHGEDDDARRDVLNAEALAPAAAAMADTLDTRLGAIGVDVRGGFTDFLDALIEPGLQDIMDGLEAARRVASLGLVTLPHQGGRKLKDMRRELEQIAHKMERLIGELQGDDASNREGQR